MCAQICKNDAKALNFILEMTRNADSIQEKVLTEILNQSKDVEYLKRFDLNGATDRHTFKSKIPIITYEDIRSDIDRIANGDRYDILSAQPILEFISSFETFDGGVSKLIPLTKEELNVRNEFNSLLMAVINYYVPGLDEGKALHFMFVESETRTKGGLLIQPYQYSIYKSDTFKASASNLYTSPIESILCIDSFQSMYSQMLCGLIESRQVLRVGATFASDLLRAINFLEQNWRELARDIMSGTLSDRVTDTSVRDSTAKILKPDLELAEFISSECLKDNWEGIITRIWPNTIYIDTIVTGAMAKYIPTLNYYTGGLPIVCAFYSSSKCAFGLNLNPMCEPSEVSYTLMPNMAYFEFLPIELANDSSTKFVDLVDVEIDKEYEIVITNRAGLYRYRVGDILRVTGFQHSAPRFHFVRRDNIANNIDVERKIKAEMDNAS